MPAALERLEYVLDTNALYRLSDDILHDLEATTARLTVGLGTLFEVVAGIPDKRAGNADHEFRCRRAAVRRWQRWITPARTIWLSPSEARLRAFGKPVVDHYDAFREILRVLAKCDTLRHFEGEIARLSARTTRVPPLDWYRKERGRLHREFRRVLRQSIHRTRETSLEQIPANVGETDRRAQRRIERDLRTYQTAVGDTERLTLLVLAQQAGLWDGELPESSAYEAVLAIEQQVRPMFDGSVDAYIRAYSLYITRRSVTGSDARDGDSLDLDQFVYLRPYDPLQVLVTGDEDLRKLCLEVLPDRAISVDTLIASERTGSNVDPS
jgi:hypothetical protein